MKTLSKTFSFSHRLYAALLTALILWGGLAQAASVPLADEPLGATSSSVPPTILITADDSESMILNHIPDDLPTLANACWKDGGYRCDSPATVHVEGICMFQNPPMMAAAFNGMAYNPLVDYAPPRTGVNGASLPDQTNWSSVAWSETGVTSLPTKQNLTVRQCDYSMGSSYNDLDRFYLKNAPKDANNNAAWKAVFDTKKKLLPHYYRTSVKWCKKLRADTMADPGDCQEDRWGDYKYPYYYSTLGDDPQNASARDNTVTPPFELVVLDATNKRVFSSRTGA
ncbi:MAG: hypothetical protein LBE75_03745 [Burkholderiales bacterium]|jgi:hypothetical protein|nr:hypothetical protein [Burkholderiales bacterium]